MSYPRVNTIQAAKAGASGVATVLKLPNKDTTSPVVNAVSGDQRWRLKFLSASFDSAPPGPLALTVTDGVFIFTFDVIGPLVLDNIDWQCAPGAEVVITLAALTSHVGHINVSATVEG